MKRDRVKCREGTVIGGETRVDGPSYSVVWVIMRRKVVWHRRFRITCGSHFQWSTCPSRRTAWSLKVGLIFPKRRFQTTLRRIITQKTKKVSMILKLGPIGSPETSVSNTIRRVIAQKTEEFSSTAGEASDLAEWAKRVSEFRNSVFECPGKHSQLLLPVFIELSS